MCRFFNCLIIILFARVCVAQSADQPAISDPAAAKPAHWSYDTDLLPATFHAQRRQALRNLLPDSSAAVFFANPVRNRSNDVQYEYHQDPNFYYLTGLREPHAMLLIFKEPTLIGDQKMTELLFVQPRDPANEMWDGKRLGTAGAKQFLEFEHVLENTEFSFSELDFAAFSHLFYINPKEDIRDDRENRGDLHSLVKHFRQKIEDVPNGSDPRALTDHMARLRQVKLKPEIELMRKAIDATCMAQHELIKTLRPGLTEYEAEALVEYIFKKNGSEYPGFPSILGGGENSCTLHYVTNRKTLESGDLLVADIGAEYHGYTADVTRTLPVNGTFSPEQTLIYNLVLEAQNAGIAACKPGNKFWEPNQQARAIIARGLIKLGITETWLEADRYFIHGTSHYLGLDVHDTGLFGELQAGNVITVEPGIYIPEGSPCDPKWWNIGVRIEDDILITTTSYENLSDCVPKTISEIEALMKEEIGK